MKKVLMATLTLLLVAGGAMANGPGGAGGRGGDGGPGGGGPLGGNVLVASDGTAFVTRTVTDSATNTSTTQLIAVRSTGTTAWTITLTNRRGLLLSGSNLLSVADSTGTDGVASSTITAISTATGATAWTLTRAGHITDLEPFSGGTYAIVVTPAATSGAAATRSLIAISGSGTVLWSASL